MKFYDELIKSTQYDSNYFIPSAKYFRQHKNELSQHFLIQALSGLTGIPVFSFSPPNKIEPWKGCRSSATEELQGLMQQHVTADSILTSVPGEFLSLSGTTQKLIIILQLQHQIQMGWIATGIFLSVQKHTEHSSLLKEPHMTSCHASQQHLRTASPNSIRFNHNVLVQQ